MKDWRVLPDPEQAQQEYMEVVGREKPAFVRAGTILRHCRWDDILVGANVINFELLEERVEQQGRRVRIGTPTPETLLFMVQLNGFGNGITAGFERADDAFAFALLKAEQKGIERVREVFPGSVEEFQTWVDAPHVNLDGRTPRLALRQGAVEKTITSAMADRIMAA